MMPCAISNTSSIPLEYDLSEMVNAILLSPPP
eukprot:CAMPEP_0172546528 /NCGR_PEP_ID=MMETSP1067-20121228/16282_1 /TAXON_ID=265564 ORGANISM="Thalassiosira punctigera, Strain Tpunct2005C2" /NCGR_SAMPLE_ID=MMETSP1067 /ASSEMBLY_ACC=CAM_ASM_000444 /LENGTH=31 /DNA_ID= /DNA_START= /DNA_END= /DNA_ORIENTATION=